MKIIEVLGTPPVQMLSQAQKARRFFDKSADGTYTPRKSRDGKKVIACSVRLIDFYMFVTFPCITAFCRNDDLLNGGIVAFMTICM